MRSVIKAVSFVIILVMLAVPAFAASDVVQPGDDFYFLDTANVLSEETEGEIFFCNQLLYEACGAQIVVAALDTIDGADIYDYACEMFDAWGIGSAEENNGFLLLMTIEEDNYYALPGSGIDGIFSASELKRLLDSKLEDDFAAKNYDAGAKKFFEAVFEKIADKYNADVSIQQGIENYKSFKTDSAAGVVDTVIASSHGGGGTAAVEDNERDSPEEDEELDLLTKFIVIMILLGMFSRMRGGSFFFWGPLIFRLLSGGRRRSSSGSSGWTSYRGGGGSYSGRSGGSYSGRTGGSYSGRTGGSYSGRSGSSFTGSRGGFGGASGGGGRSFGGGAGRGRH